MLGGQQQGCVSQVELKRGMVVRSAREQPIWDRPHHWSFEQASAVVFFFYGLGL